MFLFVITITIPFIGYWMIRQHLSPRLPQSMWFEVCDLCCFINMMFMTFALQDYPSIAHLHEKLQEFRIQPIFAVTENVTRLYKVCLDERHQCSLKSTYITISYHYWHLWCREQFSYPYQFHYHYHNYHCHQYHYLIIILYLVWVFSSRYLLRVFFLCINYVCDVIGFEYIVGWLRCYIC